MKIIKMHNLLCNMHIFLCKLALQPSPPGIRLRRIRLPLFRNVFKLKSSADFSTDQFDTIVLNLVEKIYFLC
ncbi:MAG: hypothetical protein BBJ57_04945 [Desulfobacterales bacterium PC51MH44]|nr:MAG: hypothetical protein BBJ57_04945 [Desulfobacterales bacterium PC51MH44]